MSKKARKSKAKDVPQPDAAAMPAPSVVAPDNPVSTAEVMGQPSSEHMTSAKTKKLKPPQLTQKTIIIMVIILVLGGVGGFLYHRSQQAASQQQAYDTMIKAVGVANTKRQFDVSKKLLNDFLAKYPDNKNKNQLSAIYNELGTVSMNTKDYKEAKQWLSKTVDVAPNLSFGQYFNLARSCEQGQDKECAIKYYNLALKELKTRPNSDNSGYETFIRIHIERLSQ